MTVEYGLEYIDERGATFVSPAWSEAAARRLVADADARLGRRVTVKTDPRFIPRPARVMRRECGPWTAAPTKEN